MTNETDIGAELYTLVKAEFERSIAADSTLGRLSAMKDADEYAHKVGAHLAAALAKYLKPEALPDGKLYYNIAEKVLAPTLRESHRLINDACAKVQELLDERQGLKLRPQRGEYPEERVHELINAASHAEEWSKTESILTDSVRTLTDSFYAENVRANADFRSRAGLSVEIVREGSSKCCQWCAGLVGRYAYPNEVPKDVYRRHDNCTCSVTYVNGRDRQNVWTKARWTASAERAVRLEKAENAEKPVRFTHEQARELEKRLTGGAYGGIIEYALKGSQEIEFARVNGAGRVEKKYLSQIKADYDKFTSIFGDLTLLNGFNVAPYDNNEVYGLYSPHSREITLFGIGGKNGFSFAVKTASNEKKSGMWSTSSPFHGQRHELGHALQAELAATDNDWNNKLQRIQEIFDNLSSECDNMDQSEKNTYMKNRLSIYGFQNIEEFMSECVAEYTNSPNKSRETAKKVCEILKE